MQRIYIVLVVSAFCFTANAQDNASVGREQIIPSGRTIVADMKSNNQEMYMKYQSGKKMQTTGMIMTSAGGGVMLAGAVLSIMPDTGEGDASFSIFGIKIGDVKSDGNNSGL